MTRTYIGRQLGGLGRVEVLTADGKSTLPSGPRGFSWGAEAPRSVNLARALLADVLGDVPPEGLAVVFTADVVERLPEAAFRLDADDVLAWLGDRRPRRLSGDELVVHLGTIALADEDEEAEQLSALLDRCWGPGALAN